MTDDKKLTTTGGAPVPDNQNVLTAGPRGPALMQDVWFLEKLAHFDREVIPERRMHAKGSGAYGTFTVTHDVTRYTKARIFSAVGKKTDLFMRFSTVAGERGAADAERDIRGVAMKFYTEEGNWDLVGNNTPVFFLRDPLKFPDLNHAVKRDPRTNLRSARNNWDFWTSLPEALHQVTITMSDRGIPASYRHMHAFGSHTFSLVDARSQRNWVKFHLICQQGIKNLTDAEASALVGKDRAQAGELENLCASGATRCPRLASLRLGEDAVDAPWSIVLRRAGAVSCVATFAGATLAAQRRFESGDQLGALGLAQLRFGMQRQVEPGRHLAFAGQFRRFLGFAENARPLREIELFAAFVDVALHQPRGRRDVRVPRPARLVAVAIEAGPRGEFARARRIPRRLGLHRRIGVLATVGNQLRDEKRDDEEQQGATNELLHGRWNLGGVERHSVADAAARRS